MSTGSDADNIIRQAGPVLNQHGHQIQPFGHLVKLPIALAEEARAMARQEAGHGSSWPGSRRWAPR